MDRRRRVSCSLRKQIKIQCSLLVSSTCSLATKNLCRLLKPGGDLFMTVMLRHTLNDAWTHLSTEHVKWSKYLKETGPGRFVMAFHYVPDAQRMIGESLTKAGFNVKFCDNFSRDYTYKNRDNFKGDN